MRISKLRIIEVKDMLKIIQLISGELELTPRSNEPKRVGLYFLSLIHISEPTRPKR